MKHLRGFNGETTPLARHLDLVDDLRLRAGSGNATAKRELSRLCLQGALRPYWERRRS